MQELAAERRVAELTATAEVEEMQARETTRTERMVLEAKVRTLEAQLEAAHAVIERLKQKRGG